MSSKVEDSMASEDGRSGEGQPGKADVRDAEGQARRPDVQKAAKVEGRKSYKRHLPHQVPKGFPIFLTWNLKGSLPKPVMDQLERERERLINQPKKVDETDSERKVRHGKILFAKRDQSLDAACGDMYVSLSRLTSAENDDRNVTGQDVREDKAGNVRLESLTYDGRPMWLADPRAGNEVVKSLLWGVPDRYDLFAFAVLGNHVHTLLTPSVELETVTQGIKGFTAFQINRIQNSRGRTFWQDESYDHWTRDDEEMMRVIEYIENNPVAARLCERKEDWKWCSAFWRKELKWQYGAPFQAEWKEKVERTLGFRA